MSLPDSGRVPVVPLLSRALHRIRTTPPRSIASPPTQPRRAAVALLIRVCPPQGAENITIPAEPPSLTQFFELDWVKHSKAVPEILFLHRQHDEASVAQSRARPAHPTEAHVAFPGGRTEPDDEGGLYTAMRQTWEETGIDLAEKDYTCVGALDDREITTSMGKRLLMILSPYVFLQLSPDVPSPEPNENTTLHWIPLESLVSPIHPPKWSHVTVDTASRIAPRHSATLRLLVQLLVGTMQFPAIVLKPTPHSVYPPNDIDGKQQRIGNSKISLPISYPTELKLWGLSLGMTLDLMAYMTPTTLDSPVSSMKKGSRSNSPNATIPSSMQLPYQTENERLLEIAAPRLASVFPKFSYPDVNFWIWVFGKRYREIMRGWEASVRSGGANDRRINWSGSALSSYYAAIRKALVLVIVARAVGLLLGIAASIWWIVS